MTLHLLNVQPPEEKDVTLNMDRELVAAMNKWRLEQIPPLEPNEAIVELLRRALAAENAPEAPQPQDEAFKVEALVQAFRQAASGHALAK